MKQCGNVSNYYGGIWVKEENGEYFWGIESWDTIHWEPCPKYLYNALIKHQTELEKQNDK